MQKRSLSSDDYKNYCQQRLDKVEEWGRNLTDKLPYSKSINCNAGRCAFIVNWQGMLRPCIMMDTPSVDVFETGFLKGWSIISEAASHITFSPACSVCKLLPICKVCAASAILETGNNQDKPQYICQSTHALYNMLQQTVKE